MNTISEQKDKLFQQYPSNDLRLNDIQNAQKPKYERFTNIVSKIASAVTLNDTRVFNDAAKEYRAIYENFKETGYCISECLRVKRQNEIDKIRFRLGLIERDLISLNNTKQTLEKTLDGTISRIAERTEELKEWDDKLTKFESEVE